MKIKRFNFILVLLLITSLSVYSQNRAKEMLKYTLNEKSFMKLGKSKIDELKSSLNNNDLRQNNGDKLVADNTKGAETELYAAINPNDTNNMVVSSIYFSYSPFQESALSISTYYTKDFGQTWQKSNFDGLQNETYFVAGGGDPVLVFDDEGNLHLTYIILALTDFITFKAKAFIYHAISKDGGATWERNAYFESKAFDISTFEGMDHFLDKQWMAADIGDSQYKGNVYMAFVDFSLEQGAERGNIKVDTYHPSDTSFVYDPVTVSSDSFYFVQFSSIDVDNEGNVFVGFVGSADSLNYFIYNSVSTDGGHTFSEPVIVSKVYYPGYTGGSAEAALTGVATERYYPAPYLAVDKSNGIRKGRIYFSWTAPGIDSLSAGSYDIYLSYSDDKGKTWSLPMIVNNDKIINSDQFYSAINVNESGIPILCFYDKRNDIQKNHGTDYYIAYPESMDSLIFSVQFPVTAKESDFSLIGAKTDGFGIGEYNKTVTTANYALPFWADGRTNTGDINIYMAYVPLDGEDHSSGIEYINQINSSLQLISIAPNPAINSTSLIFANKKTSDIHLFLTDVTGKLVYENYLGITLTGEHTAEIDLTSFKSGLYFVRIQSSDGFAAARFNVVK